MITWKQESRPPFVRFEVKPKLNPVKSQEQGRQCYDNVTYAIVMQHGGKDEFVKEAVEWIAQKKREAANGAYPPDWVELFERGLKAFHEGNEIPLDGTPLATIPMLTPAEVQNFKAINILTLEDACDMNESAMAHFGLSARSIRDKLRAYRDAGANQGKVAEEVSALKVKLAESEGRAKDMEARVRELEALVIAGSKKRKEEPLEV